MEEEEARADEEHAKPLEPGLEREWNWPWARDDKRSAASDPRLSFMGKLRSFFGLETAKEAEQIAFLEAKKVGYTFPHYSEDDRECFLAVRPGFLEQCRNEAHGSIGEALRSETGECETSAECECNRFDLEPEKESEVPEGTNLAADGPLVDKYKRVGMPCGDNIAQFLVSTVPHISTGRFLDPSRYSWPAC